MTYNVTVKAECSMIVRVEAASRQEALAIARADDYDEPLTDWEPVFPRKLRAMQVWTQDND